LDDNFLNGKICGKLKVLTDFEKILIRKMDKFKHLNFKVGHVVDGEFEKVQIPYKGVLTSFFDFPIPELDGKTFSIEYPNDRYGFLLNKTIKYTPSNIRQYLVSGKVMASTILNLIGDFYSTSYSESECITLKRRGYSGDRRKLMEGLCFETMLDLGGGAFFLGFH
jgi:hypothetical protein